MTRFQIFLFVTFFYFAFAFLDRLVGAVVPGPLWLGIVVYMTIALALLTSSRVRMATGAWLIGGFGAKTSVVPESPVPFGRAVAFASAPDAPGVLATETRPNTATFTLSEDPTGKGLRLAVTFEPKIPPGTPFDELPTQYVLALEAYGYVRDLCEQNGAKAQEVSVS